ncbi:MAG: peptidyl-prolyl cis-trans isomerase [candidate division WOR-3 bacterium]|nr:MAG: peptidyl-prolyl cis-trans isomerase [candidate division WOR-3 bacterium]
MRRYLVPAILILAAGAGAAGLGPSLDSLYHHYSVEDFDAASDLLERMTATFTRGGDRFVVALEKGDFLLDKMRDFAAAESAYAKLLEEFPKDKRRPDVLYRLALAQEMQEKYLDGAKNYEQVATRYMKSRFGTDALDAIERCFRKNYQDRVAYVDGFPITRIEIDDRISRNPSAYEAYEKKVALLDDMINERLWAVAAEESDVLEDPAQRMSLSEARNRIVFEEWYEREVKDKAEPSAKQVKAQYRADRDAKYTTPEKVHAWQIVFKTLELAEMHRAVLLRDTTAATWDSVCAGYSTAPDKDQGGDMGFFARGVHPKEIEDPAFRLKPGKISKPIQTENGFVLLKVTDRQAKVVRPFEEAKNQITVQLRQSNMNELYEKKTEELKKAAVIETDSNAVHDGRDTLAVVNGSVIDRAALDLRINTIPPFYRSQFQTPEGQQRILDQLILEKLILVDAERSKAWLWNRAVDKWLARRTRMLTDAYRIDMVNNQVVLDTAELKADYQATIDDFKEPAKVHAREIVCPTLARANQVRAWVRAGRLPPLVEGRALAVTDQAKAGATKQALADAENTDSMVATGSLADPPAVIQNTPTLRVGNRHVPDMAKPNPLAGPYRDAEFFGLAFVDLTAEDRLYQPALRTATTGDELAGLLGEPLETDSAGVPVVDSARLGTYVTLEQALPSSFVSGLFRLEAGEVSEPFALDGARLVAKVTRKDTAVKAEFADIAKKFSTAASRWSGGDMYWIARDDKSRDPKVVSRAFSLSEGRISEVMRLNDSTYTFVKVEEKKKALTRPFDEVRGKIENKLRRSKEEELHAKVLQDLHDAADIEIVMTEEDFIFEPPETVPPEPEEGTEPAPDDATPKEQPEEEGQ